MHGCLQLSKWQGLWTIIIVNIAIIISLRNTEPLDRTRTLQQQVFYTQTRCL